MEDLRYVDEEITKGKNKGSFNVVCGNQDNTTRKEIWTKEQKELALYIKCNLSSGRVKDKLYELIEKFGTSEFDRGMETDCSFI